MGVAEASASRAPRVDTLQLALIGALIALAAVAWVVTDGRMDGMDMGPGGELGSLGFYVSAWVVMMAAMMFPSISPMVRTYALVLRRRPTKTIRPAAGISLFVTGYLVAWTGFGLAAYGLITLVDRVDLAIFDWADGGRYVAGGVILAAAVYQLTPLKDACLTRCRSPLDFLLERWRDGLGGTVLLGLEHGAWCVGCCWALMAALFALGVMSVTWMVFVAALIAIEKLLPWKRVANRGIAGALAVLGLAVAIAPGSVPGLTVPGSSGESMGGMGSMREAPAGDASMETPLREAPAGDAPMNAPMRDAPMGGASQMSPRSPSSAR
jgi:predicted metal-binding membrane protein